MVCAPEAVDEGIVTDALTAPVASAVAVRSTTGVECNVIVTVLSAFQPVDATVALLPALGVEGVTSTPPSPVYDAFARGAPRSMNAATTPNAAPA